MKHIHIIQEPRIWHGPIQLKTEQLFGCIHLMSLTTNFFLPMPQAHTILSSAFVLREMDIIQDIGDSILEQQLNNRKRLDSDYDRPKFVKFDKTQFKAYADS